MSLSTFSVQLPTNDINGNPLVEPITAVTLFIDTVNPPVKSYSVPAANIGAGAAGSTVTVTFAQLGFTPVNNTAYFADCNCTDAAGTSADSAVDDFTYVAPPAAPSAPTLKVS